MFGGGAGLEPIRGRVGTSLSQSYKSASFASIFLTLVSIVVALGIEQLLQHVSESFGEASPSARPLIVAQSVTMFLVVGAIWISYASMLMLGTWDPRFEDFYAPLAILTLLYFAIQAIGTNQAAWFVLTAVGWGFAGLSQWFRFPTGEESRMHERRDGWRSILCLLGLSVAGLACGVASLLGALGTAAAAVVVAFQALGQLASAWLHFRWLRTA